MSKLFILGAGFSKAVSSDMPVLRDLGNRIAATARELPGDSNAYHALASDPEVLLTYLYQALPWKHPEEDYLHKSAFTMLSRHIAEYIAECERKALEGTAPDWCQAFVQYLHREATTVATLNYDTILERLSQRFIQAASDEASVGLEDSYQMPIVDLGQRAASMWGKNACRSYRLLKLHGS